MGVCRVALHKNSRRYVRSWVSQQEPGWQSNYPLSFDRSLFWKFLVSGHLLPHWRSNRLGSWSLQLSRYCYRPQNSKRSDSTVGITDPELLIKQAPEFLRLGFWNMTWRLLNGYFDGCVMASFTAQRQLASLQHFVIPNLYYLGSSPSVFSCNFSWFIMC